MQFTDEYKWDIVTGSVMFISRDDGHRLVHQVSEEALEDFFGSSAPAAASADIFSANRIEIQRLAEIAVTEGQLNRFGGANITSEWLSAKRYRRNPAG
jgi:hypothetical protein